MAESDVAGERERLSEAKSLERARADYTTVSSLLSSCPFAVLFSFRRSPFASYRYTFCSGFASPFHSLQDDIDEETRALWKQEAMNRERTGIEVFIMDVSVSAISERARGRSPRRVSLPQHIIGAPRRHSRWACMGHTVSSLQALVSDSRVAHRVFGP